MIYFLQKLENHIFVAHDMGSKWTLNETLIILYTRVTRIDVTFLMYSNMVTKCKRIVIERRDRIPKTHEHSGDVTQNSQTANVAAFIKHLQMIIQNNVRITQNNAKHFKKKNSLFASYLNDALVKK